MWRKRWPKQRSPSAALARRGCGIINAERHELNVVHDTELDHGQTSLDVSLQLGEGLVGRAGQFGRMLATLTTGSLATEYRAGTSIAGTRSAMIVGARIVGVLELTSADPAALDESSVDVMHSLAGRQPPPLRRRASTRARTN